MAQWHLRSKKGPTGSKLTRIRKKKRRDRGVEFFQTKVEKRESRALKARGKRSKVKLLSENRVSLADPATKKVTLTTILSVKENAANPHYVRRNILTKGAVIETEAGTARVTSRPGQHGVVHAVLLKK